MPSRFIGLLWGGGVASALAERRSGFGLMVRLAALVFACRDILVVRVMVRVVVEEVDDTLLEPPFAATRPPGRRGGQGCYQAGMR